MDEQAVQHAPIQQGTIEIVTDALISALLDIDAYEEHLPCVLICADRVTGEQTFSGPFSSLAAGERIRLHEVAAAGPFSSLMFSLAALYPPLELNEASVPAFGTASHPGLPASLPKR